MACEIPPNRETYNRRDADKKPDWVTRRFGNGQNLLVTHLAVTAG